MTTPRVTYGVWLTAAFVTVALLSLGIGLLTGMAQQQQQPGGAVKGEPGAHCPAGDGTTRPQGAGANISLTPTPSQITMKELQPVAA